MAADIEALTQSYIHCIISKGREGIFRPLAEAVHTDRPNKVVHVDFLYMGPAVGADTKYLLLLGDNHVSYTWLHLCSNADSDGATGTIAQWIASFGCMSWSVTDQSFHLVASLMKLLVTEARIRHHPGASSCPWAHGAMEILCLVVARIFKALKLEWRLPAEQ